MVKEKQLERESNIELFRVFLIIMVIAHHYVVNSGICDLWNYSNISGNMIFSILYGWGGKVAINGFLLITGYFMCEKKWKLERLVRLWIEVKLYQIVIFAIFLLTGYCECSFSELYENVFSVILGMNREFIGSYFALLLVIPFVNILIQNMGRNRHLIIIVVLIWMYTINVTFLFNPVFEYLPWYVNMYLLGAYIRKYSSERWDNVRVGAFMSIVSTMLAVLSMLFMIIVNKNLERTFSPYYFVMDCNKILALGCGLSYFIFFKNWNIGYHPIINKISKSTFGVLQIHACNGIMRQWLWKDVLRNTNMYYSQYMWMHAIVSTIMVWGVCTIIDQIRIRWIEKPMEGNLDKMCGAIQEKIEKRIGL